MPLVDNTWYISGRSQSAHIVNIGTQSVTTTTASVNQTGVNVPSGALIVVIAHENTAVAAGSSGCSDGTNGAYSVATSLSTGASFGQIFYFANSAALTNATITYTKSLSTDTPTTLSYFFITGLATSTPLDGTFTATVAFTTSTTPTVTSGAAAADGEFVIGACCYKGAGTATYTQPATPSWTNPPNNQNANAGAQIGAGFVINQGSSAVTYNPTLSGAGTNGALLVVAFKPLTTPTTGWHGVPKWVTGAKVAGALVRQAATPLVQNERVFVCTVAGTSGGSEPVWVLTRGAATTDNTVTWSECTGQAGLNGDISTTGAARWVSASTWVLGQVIYDTVSLSLQFCTTAGAGITGSPPTFSATAGTITADNVARWTSLGLASNFTIWNAPALRLTQITTTNWGAAGDTFFVSDAHSEMYSLGGGGTYNWTFNTSPSLWTNCICVKNAPSATPPVGADVSTGATITGPNVVFTITCDNTNHGFVAINGLNFYAYTGMNQNANAGVMRLDNCIIGKPPGTGAQGFGINGAGRYFWNAVSCAPTNSGDFINIIGNSYLLWQNSIGLAPGAATGLSLRAAANNCGIAILRGIDFTGFATANFLAIPANQPGVVQLVDCKLPAGFTIPNPSPGIFLDVVRSDSANTIYQQQRYLSTGSLTAETTVIRTGGASDGTTPLSWKIVTTATISWINPFETFPLTIWNPTTGVVNVTIHATSNLAAGAFPKTDDIWLEAEYLGTIGFPLGVLVTGTKANVLATGTPYSTDGASWGGSPAGGTFAMTLALNVSAVGYINLFVKCAKPSTTFWVDPLVVFS